MSESTSFPITPDKAGCCGAIIRMVSNMEGQEQPGPGDFTICAECGTICRFDANMHQSPATEGELLTLELEDPKLHHYLIEMSRFTRFLRVSCQREGEEFVKHNSGMMSYRYHALVRERMIDSYLSQPIDKPWNWAFGKRGA